MYLFRRISHEKNLTKKGTGNVKVYQSLNPDLNHLIACAKSNVASLDDKLPNWHVHVKNPDQKYHPGCVFQAEGMTQFMWETVFSVGQEYFKENDNFNTTSEKAGKSPSWCIMVNFDSMYLPKAWKSKLEKYQYSCCERYSIRQQRIQSVSRITPCGNEVLNNIALYICNYLTFISRIDMNLKDFSDFIDNNMEKTDDPTHYLTKPDWVPGNRSLVVYKQYDEFDKYRAAALGKNKYDESGYLDHHQTQAILLRYFNVKYHGTIYEVRH